MEGGLFIALALGAFSCLIAFFLISRMATDLYAIYRQNFLTHVDKGLRDIFLFMNPRQLLTLTIIIAIVIGIFSIYSFGLLTGLAIIGLVLAAPTLVLPVLKTRRAEAFEKQLPDALTSMAAAMRSGLNLTKAMTQIVKTQPNPISQEFAQVLGDHRVGRDLGDSLDDMVARISREDLVLFVASVKISREVGGNLSQTLESLAETLRERRKMEGKVEALTSMGVMQGRAAMLLPVVASYVLYLLEPEAMTKLFTSQLGQILLVVIVMMMFSARILIRKIIKINV